MYHNRIKQSFFLVETTKTMIDFYSSIETS